MNSWRSLRTARTFAQNIATVVGVAALCFGMSACKTELPIESGMGVAPTLPPPRKEILPTVHIAPAIGWPMDAAPLAAAGLKVNRFADALDHPRWLYVLPNGDVLVAESKAPPREGKVPLGDRIMAIVMKRAGAGGPSANRITLLRDADGDGVAEIRHPFLEGLSSPFGMALAGGWLYIANTDAIVRVPYSNEDVVATAAPVKVLDLPGGPINHHWTKNVIASPDGSRLYATVGSNSNVQENGEAHEEGRAAVWEIDAASGQAHVFASGLRNPNGLAWNPDTGALWVAVNERDAIGGNLVPDYMTVVHEGGFYGWPYSYFGQHVDERVSPQRPDLVSKALPPDYALGSHTGSLGLAFAPDGGIGSFRNGAFIGQHGSWNRRPRSGYKVIFVPFVDGHPVGPAVDVLTGFVNDEGDAMGRPVGVVFDQHNALLVADDVGNVIWRVTQ